MKKRGFDEKGFTLLELLATLVLFSVFGIIIWSFFFQSLNYNKTETLKKELQQEANIILNTLQQVHTKSDSYEIGTFNSQNTLIINSDLTNVEFKNKNIKYNLSESKTKANGDYYLNLKLYSKEQPSIKLEIETTFSKLK